MLGYKGLLPSTNISRSQVCGGYKGLLSSTNISRTQVCGGTRVFCHWLILQCSRMLSLVCVGHGPNSLNGDPFMGGCYIWTLDI